MLTTSHRVTNATKSSLLNLPKPDILEAKTSLFHLPLSLFLFLSMTIHSTAHPTGKSGSTVQAVSLHNLLPTPSPTRWAGRVEESFDAVQARTSQNIAVLSTLF